MGKFIYDFVKHAGRGKGEYSLYFVAGNINFLLTKKYSKTIVGFECRETFKIDQHKELSTFIL